MLKKAISTSVLAAAALVSGQAMALQDAGFESASSVGSWDPAIGGVIERRTAGPVTIYDDTFGDFSTGYSVNPVSGSAFGLLTPNYGAVDPVTLKGSPTQMYAFNMSGTPTVAGDKFYVRLFSAEYDLAHNANNDSVTVTFNNNADPTTSFTWSVSDTYKYVYGNADPYLGIHPDSGWLEVSNMPVGTNSIYIKINETSLEGGNIPVVAVDFAPAAAVPEADASAMMLAGLGMMGMLARRRMKKSA